MAPDSSPRGETNNVLLPQVGSEAVPVTPVKRTAIAKQNITPQSNDTPPSSTIRERRGRKCDPSDGSFRPLSIFTKSLLLPFNLDTDKALDALQSDSPDRLDEAKNALSPDREKTMDICRAQAHSTPLVLHRSHISSGSRSTEETEQSGQDSDMDLITALKSTFPEKDSASKITADFATLCELPIPEPCQHPAFSGNPFDVRTEAPLLFTSTHIDKIRLFSSRDSPDGGQASYPERESMERKRSFFGHDLRTPAPARSRNAFNSENSPLNTTVSQPKDSNSRGSIRGSSPLIVEFVTPKESASSNSTTSSVRKFSDLFKRKDSIEKTLDSPSWSPRQSQESPNLERSDLERYLRRTTNTPTYDYDPHSPYPRHPNTGRGWKSRNLKCTTCTEGSCAVCHRVCCAYRAAVLACDAREEGSPGRNIANQRIQEITRLFPYGREAPTFLQCTAGIRGDEAGCGKLVCPDCCSICLDDLCGDTLCRKCKPAMWEECEWHKGEILRPKVAFEVAGLS